MNKKDVSKVLVVTRLTGTFAFASLIKTAELQFYQPTEVGTDVSSANATEFNIIEIIRRAFDRNDDLDVDSGNSVANNDRRPSSGRRPSSNKKPSSSKPNPGAKPSAKPDSKPSGNGNGKPNGNKPSGNEPSAKPDNKPNGSKPNGNNKPSDGVISFDTNVEYGSPSESIELLLLNERDALNVEAKQMSKSEALRTITPYKFTLKNNGTVHFNTNLKADILKNTLNVAKKDVRVYVEDNYGNKVFDGTFDNIDDLFNKDIRISRFMDRSFKMWAWLDVPVDKETRGKFEFKLSAFATQVR